MFTLKTSLIIPTRNRSKQLIDLLNNLIILKIRFSEILIIDSSKNSHSKKIKLYCNKKKIKYFFSKPSTSYQRNLGLKKANPNTFIMFMDDDVVFLRDTFTKMDEFIIKNKNNAKIAGFGFNQIQNVKENILEKINDKETYYSIQAERALLEAIGGDCDTAIGGLAKLSNEKILLKSELFSNDGKKKFESQSSGNFREAREIGYKVGEELLKKAGSDFKTQGS